MLPATRGSLYLNALICFVVELLTSVAAQQLLDRMGRRFVLAYVALQGEHLRATM
jgi:hypothetical protein